MTSRENDLEVAEKRGNVTPVEQNFDQKRSRSEQSSSTCIIHCTDDDTELVRPKDEETWSTLVRGERLLFVNTNTFLMFTFTENVEACGSPWKSSWKQFKTDDQQPTAAKRTSIWQSPTTSTTYQHVCILCEKKSEYILREKGIGSLNTMQRFACWSLNWKICYGEEGQQDSRNCVAWNRSSSSLLPQDMLRGLY